MKVTVYTRHINDCPKRNDRSWRHCHCPKWLAISTDRGFSRQSAKTLPWDKAEQKAKAMEQQPPKHAGRASDPAESSKRKTIESAVENFLTNKSRMDVPDLEATRIVT